MTIFGLSSSSGAEFVRFIPYVFVVAAIVLVANNKYQNSDHYFFYGLVLILSYVIHLILSKLEIVELNPNYTATLGIRIFGIPLIVPIIWFFMVNTMNGMLRKFPFHDLVKSFIGASLIMIMDVFLEAQAQKFGFWNWGDDPIPMANYVWWFFIAFGFLLASFKLNIRNHTFTSVAAYILLLLFFVASDAIAF